MRASEVTPVVFLLGAGASVEAGLPLLRDLTREVRNGWLGGPGPLPPDLHRIYEELRVGDLLPHERRERNIEDVLSAADGLTTARLQHRGRGPRDFANLAHATRKRIWWRLGQDRRFKALDNLAPILHEHHGLAIASLNNDLVIEKWARSRGLALSRGFDGSGGFDCRLLVSSTDPIRLAKLHGSIDWVFEAATGLRQVEKTFRTARGMTPLRSPLPDSAIVFPSRVKAVELTPLRELFVLFGNWLSTAAVLVVVGCALGDAHVVEAIQEARRRNPHLRVLVVEPSPGPVLDRLLHARGGERDQKQVDGLASTFGDSLVSGRLAWRIREAIAGRPSLGMELRRLLASGVPAETEGFLEIARRVTSPQVSASDLAEAASLIGGCVPPEGVEGVGAERMTCVPSSLATGGGIVLGETLRNIASAATTLPQGEPACAAGVVYVLQGGSRSSLGRIDPHGGFQRIHSLTGRAGGLGLGEEKAVYVQQHLQGREGLGLLRVLDLETGRSERRLLIRKDRQILRGLLQSAGAAVRHGLRSPAARHEQKALARSLGFLLWSLKTCWLAPGLWLVVESREASVVELRSGRVRFSTGSVFLNLTDVAAASPDSVFLLEGGYAGEGRLLRWRPSTGEVETVLEPLRSHGGVAVDRQAQVLRLALTEAGMVLELDLDDEGRVRGERVVAEGLLRPRWITTCGSGEWWISTRWGVVKIS